MIATTDVTSTDAHTILTTVERWVRDAYPEYIQYWGENASFLRILRRYRAAIDNPLFEGVLPAYLVEGYQYALQRYDPSLRWSLFRRHVQYLLRGGAYDAIMAG